VKVIINTVDFYNPKGFNNDIVLLKISPALTFNTNVKPACLPKEGFTPESTGALSIVSGWGRLNYDLGVISDTLNYVHLPLMTNEQCKASWLHITPSMVCAGFIPGGEKSSCKGDSGGPLVVPDANGNAIIYGVVSHGIEGCTKPGFPAVYARVSKFLSWIQSNLVTFNYATISSIIFYAQK